MNKKLIVAIIGVVLVVALAGCVEKPVETPPPATPTPTPKPTPKPTPTPTPVEAKPPVETSCDMCHKRESTAELEAHVKGGLLVNGKPGCFDYADKPNLAKGCHGGKDGNATVHTVHPATVGCAVCHGKIPTIPEKGPGGTTCELCHGYPDPTKPSEGRLVEIHLSRGKPCTVCHIGEISEIHGLK